MAEVSQSWWTKPQVIPHEWQYRDKGCGQGLLWRGALCLHVLGRKVTLFYFTLLNTTWPCKVRYSLVQDLG